MRNLNFAIFGLNDSKSGKTFVGFTFYSDIYKEIKIYRDIYDSNKNNSTLDDIYILDIMKIFNHNSKPKIIFEVKFSDLENAEQCSEKFQSIYFEKKNIYHLIHDDKYPDQCRKIIFAKFESTQKKKKNIDIVKLDEDFSPIGSSDEILSANAKIEELEKKNKDLMNEILEREKIIDEYRKNNELALKKNNEKWMVEWREINEINFTLEKKIKSLETELKKGEKNKNAQDSKNVDQKKKKLSNDEKKKNNDSKKEEEKKNHSKEVGYYSDSSYSSYFSD